MSLIDNVNESSGIAVEGESVKTGEDFVTEQINASVDGAGAQSEEQVGAHTDGENAGKAASDLGPEDEKTEQDESLVSALEDSSAEAEKPAGDEAKAADGAEGEEGAQTEEGAKALTDEAKAALRVDMLGVDPVDMNLDPVVRERIANKDRFIQQLEQERRDENADTAALLKTLGRKIIQTANGPQMTVSDDAKDFSADDINVKDILNGLSEKERELLNSDEEGSVEAGVAIITKKVAEAFASAVPPVTAKPEEEVLTASQRNEVFYSFTAEKLSDGVTARFPDCDKPEIRTDLEQALRATDDRMTALYEAGQKDPKIQSALLELAYLRVKSFRQAMMTLETADKTALASETKSNKKLVSVKGSGSGNAAVQTEKSVDKGEAILDFLEDANNPNGKQLRPNFA